jgi:hypothetical protein
MTSSSFRDFADKFAVRTSVELDAERRPVLDTDEGEAIASTFAPVELVAGDEEQQNAAGVNGAAAPPSAASGARLGAGALYVTTRRVVWVPDAASAANGSPCVSLTYRQIVMHAVATDAAQFARPCLYLQLDEGEGGGGDEGEGGGEGEGEGGEDEEGGAAAGPAPELRLVPADPAQGEASVASAAVGVVCVCSRLPPLSFLSRSR